MHNASKSVKFCMALTMVAICAVLDFSFNMAAPSTAPATKVVASRYQLRSRTPNFFSRSKTAPATQSQSSRSQPVVRRG